MIRKLKNQLIHKRRLYNSFLTLIISQNSSIPPNTIQHDPKIGPYEKSKTEQCLEYDQQLKGKIDQ